MDVLTAALACSLHGDLPLVRAVVEVQSEGHALFVGDISELQGTSSANTVEAAELLVKGVLNKGHKVLVGLMGVPREWAGIYGLHPLDLWDSCKNIEVATAKLSDYAAACRRPAGSRWAGTKASLSDVRACILKRFAGAVGVPAAFPKAVFEKLYASPSGKAGPTSPGRRDHDAESLPNPYPSRAD